jgi:hypothetical protein
VTIPLPTIPALRTFAEAFFTQFEAQIEASPDELIIDLPPRLVGHFGKPRLYLVFPTAQGTPRVLSPHEDLLVYGSRTFDLMLALLDGQGETARLEYPRQVSLALADAPGPSLRRPQFTVTEIAVDRRQEWYQLFNFRITYRSDEKEEAFETVALDADGQPAPAVEALLRQLAPLPQSPPPPGAFTPQPEQATAALRHRAAVRAEELQRQIRSRLERTLLRLTSFYQRRIAEIDSDQPERDEQLIAELQQELERKIVDELERHQLHTRLTPLSTAQALLPSVHVRLSVSAGSVSRGCRSTPISTLPLEAVAALAGGTLHHKRYRWQQFATEDYTLYIGHRRLWGVAILALDYAGKPLQFQHTNWFQTVSDATLNHTPTEPIA